MTGPLVSSWVRVAHQKDQVMMPQFSFLGRERVGAWVNNQLCMCNKASTDLLNQAVWRPQGTPTCWEGGTHNSMGTESCPCDPSRPYQYTISSDSISLIKKKKTFCDRSSVLSIFLGSLSVSGMWSNPRRQLWDRPQDFCKPQGVPKLAATACVWFLRWEQFYGTEPLICGVCVDSS